MEPLAAAVMMCTPMTSGPIPEPVAVVEAFIDAYNRHDADDVRELVTEDAVIGAPGNMTVGRDMADSYEKNVFTAYPTIHIKVLKRLVVNDLVAQTELISDWPYADMTGLSVYRVDRGCIVSMSINVESK